MQIRIMDKCLTISIKKSTPGLISIYNIYIYLSIDLGVYAKLQSAYIEPNSSFAVSSSTSTE